MPQATPADDEEADQGDRSAPDGPISFPTSFSDAVFPCQVAFQLPPPELLQRGWARGPRTWKVNAPPEAEEFLNRRWVAAKGKVVAAKLREQLVQAKPGKEQLHMFEHDIQTLMGRWQSKKVAAGKKAQKAPAAAAAAGAPEMTEEAVVLAG